MKAQNPPPSSLLCELPWDVQVNLLTFLRAFDLSAVQQTCRFYGNPVLADAVVRHFSGRVYTPELTDGFEKQPVLCNGRRKIIDNDEKDYNKEGDNGDSFYYTFEHLRNMELLVVCKVLARPEPSGGRGFVVSKSWCKAALRWLEVREQQILEQQQQQLKRNKTNKLSRKQRVRNRRLSDASPPWPNVNNDLLCEHRNLQYCLSKKSARARRRILDKQDWKMLKKLYPDSNELDAASGECLQCALVAETEKKSALNKVEQGKLQRKQPLTDPVIRQFYTRTRGVPVQALRNNRQLTIEMNNEDEDLKLPAASASQCPLRDGLYYILPRAWCHGWRRYIKTGEGIPSASDFSSWPAPDAAGLLCDAHRLPLLPPHLEAYLYGQCPQLLLSGSTISGSGGSSHSLSTVHEGLFEQGTLGPALPSAARARIPGQAPDPVSLLALRAAGLSEVEVSRQLSAMRLLEQQANLRAPAMVPMNNNDVAASSSSENMNELLDRENYSVVEILTHDEFVALEKQCWPGSSVFCLGFQVCSSASVPGSGIHDAGIQFSTPPCRKCDASGRQDSCSLSIKNRARGWVRKSSEKSRAPASLEY